MAGQRVAQVRIVLSHETMQDHCVMILALGTSSNIADATSYH